MANEGTEKKGLKAWKKWHWAIVVLVIILIILGIWIWHSHSEMSKIASLIDDQSKKYADPAKAKQLLTDAAAGIIDNPIQSKNASKFAKDFGVTYEQAVVNMAVAQLTAGGFLAQL